VLILLLSLSILLYREFLSALPGIISPWRWVFLGFFWSLFQLSLPYAHSIPLGNTVFHGCIEKVKSQGQKTFSAVLMATLDDGTKEEIHLLIPSSRVRETPQAGECFSGDVSLSDHPDRAHLQHGFLSFLDNGNLQGEIRPWNAFVADRERIESNGQGSFSGWAPRRIHSLEAFLESRLPPDVSGLVESMVLSDTSHMSQEINNVFLGSGVYHLLSVSGEHMGLLAAFLSGSFLLVIRWMPLAFLRQILARIFVNRLLAILVIPILIAYADLIGMPPAAGRALLAAIFVLVSRGWGVSIHREDLFGISLIAMMILIPDLPRSISMDLSLMAVLGVLAALRKEENSSGSVSSDLISVETLKTGLWVTLFTTPLLWGAFHIGDFVGIFSNPVIVPLAGEVLLPVGFAYLGLAFFFGWAPMYLENFLSGCSRAVIALATFFSGIRLGQISLPSVPPVFLLIFNGWLVGLFLRKKYSRGLAREVFPLLIVITPILFLSVTNHFIGKGAGQSPLKDWSAVMPAIVRQSESVPVFEGKEALAFAGWLWSPQRELLNVSRLVQSP
jgi:competence protein ComEC